MAEVQVQRKQHSLLGIFVACLTLVFATAKAFGAGTVATWSWWTVLLPILVYVGFITGLLVFFAIAAVLVAIFSK